MPHSVESKPYLRLEAVPAEAGGPVDAGGVVGAVKVGGADGAHVGGLAGEPTVPVVPHRAVAPVSRILWLRLGGSSDQMLLGSFLEILSN